MKMEKQMNKPQLRFPEFVDVWNNDTLENLTERIGDGLHGTPEYVNNSNIHFINGNNLFDGRIQINETTKKVSIETFEQNNKNLSDKTLLISINGTIGSVARYKNEKVMLGKSVGYFNFKENPDFFYYLLNTSYIQNYFISELTGSTIKNLSLKTLRETKVNYPKNLEQFKISAFLKTIDEKIQALKKKQNLLEHYKKGVTQKIFSLELRFNDDSGNEYPKWTLQKLGDVAKITTGSSNRQDSILDGEFTFFDRSQDIRTSNRFLFDAEAIIVPGEGQEFIPKYFNGKFDLHQRTYAVMDFEGINGKFLFHSISFNSNHLNSHAVGSTVKSLRLPMFESMPINLPSIKEQTKIANFLSAIDDKVNNNNIEIENLQIWKKGLMQKMFC